MLGDWLCYRIGEDKLSMPMQVCLISESEVYLTFDGNEADPWICDVDALVPIPLTAEILEKNNFDQWTGSGDSTKMCLSPHGDGVRYNLYVGLKHKTIEVFCAPPVEKSPGWRKHNKVYLEVCGCYVHELQHALRLIGVEKEIEL